MTSRRNSSRGDGGRVAMRRRGDSRVRRAGFAGRSICCRSRLQLTSSLLLTQSL
jgi:hypothetical protein